MISYGNAKVWITNEGIFFLMVKLEQECYVTNRAMPFNIILDIEEI